MASRIVQGVLRTGSCVAKTTLGQKSLQKSISTRPVTSTPTTEIANRSAYATVAPNSHPSPASASKFNVPFDEGPMMATMDNVVEQVERIPEEIQKERGYHIIGKVKASEDQLRKILAVGDMRVWQ